MSTIGMTPSHITREMGMFTHLVHGSVVPSPAVPEEVTGHLVRFCLEAVDYAMNGELEKVMELPSNIKYRGERSMLVHEVIEAFDLEDWLY